ncbi:hypothetical protein [Pseudoalteromonas sp. C8]|uniref:hypothetical protein n=1 Tax=Pseudoalteromonas sp. C8 TaxID=2686345 RepID=UPI0013FE34CC|nr:hypothetical protein [Pseudoalteromonas sp. C8]
MKVLIFGDSHSIYFNLTNELKELNESFRGVETKVVKLTAATILGFGRRESTLNSREKFINAYNEFKPDYIVFALGQVDIELGLYYRKVVKNESFELESYLNMLCDTYLSSINELVKSLNFDNSKIILKGINLSVLTKSRLKAINYTSKIITENVNNQAEINQYKNELNTAFPSNYERYKTHIKFNQLLKENKESDQKYFDINKEIEDPTRLGQCKSIFIPAYADHHLLDSLYLRELSIQKMLSCILDL